MRIIPLDQDPYPQMDYYALKKSKCLDFASFNHQNLNEFSSKNMHCTFSIYKYHCTKFEGTNSIYKFKNFTDRKRVRILKLLKLHINDKHSSFLCLNWKMFFSIKKTSFFGFFLYFYKINYFRKINNLYRHLYFEQKMNLKKNKSFFLSQIYKCRFFFNNVGLFFNEKKINSFILKISSNFQKNLL
nr:hypothetical protein 1634Bnrm3_p119 [Cryptomonas sp.]